MENPYKRKKQPELVRRALLDEAAKIAVEGGLAAVTVQAVADAAGVTKGGFMHHFPHKQALIDAIFQEVLTSIDHMLDNFMAADPEPYGSFTRAYVEVVFEIGWEGRQSPWTRLSILMLTDANLRALWTDWFNARQKRHHVTDGKVSLTIVRLAADGIWLADLSNIDLPKRSLLRERLLGATKPHNATDT